MMRPISFGDQHRWFARRRLRFRMHEMIQNGASIEEAAKAVYSDPANDLDLRNANYRHQLPSSPYTLINWYRTTR